MIFKIYKGHVDDLVEIILYGFKIYMNIINEISDEIDNIKYIITGIMLKNINEPLYFFCDLL